MRTYELVLVFRPSISEAARKKIIEAIKVWIKQAKIEKEDHWGLKALSYRIKKETSGFFSVFSIATDAGIAGDFEKKLFEQEGVIRHLLIRKK